MTNGLQPGGNLREFAGDWTPVFADPARQYDYLDRVTSHRAIDGGVEFDVGTHGGRDAHASVVFVTPEIVRVRAWLDEAPPEGIEGGKVAGMRCIGVATTRRPERLTQADLVVASLEDDRVWEFIGSD